MSKTTSTTAPASTDEAKTQHYGFAVIGETVKMAEPAATEETALRRAAKIAEKAGAGVVPTFAVTATSRDAARKTADEVWSFGTVDSEPTATDAADDEAPASTVTREALETAQAARTSQSKRSGFYTVGTKDGATVATQSPARDAETALGIAFDADDDSVVAVKAKSRDEAVNAYEAMSGTFPENRVVSRSAASSTPRAPREAKAVIPAGGDDLSTWEPNEAEDGHYFLTKTGLLHASDTCRFVRETTPKADVDGRLLVTEVLTARSNGTALPVVDNRVIRSVCATCTGTRKAAVEAPAVDTDVEVAEPATV